MGKGQPTLAQLREKLKFICPPILVKYAGLCVQVVRFALARRTLRGAYRLHLGCGGNALEGWSNIDLGGGKSVIHLNLAKPLPVASDSVQFVFSEHFLEHLTLSQGRRFVAECYRVLAPGGILRISTPNLEAMLQAYADKSITLMSYRGWNPKTPCRMLNEGMRLWGHRFVYDHDELYSLLAESGFSDITPAQWHQSLHPELCNLECRPYHGDLIMEARK